MKKISSSLIVLGMALTLLASPSHALPSTTSWTDAGLQEMVRFSGRLTVSVDGIGTNNASGDIQVEKPAGAKVVAAYLSFAGVRTPSMPTDLQLASQVVAFTHEANSTGGISFVNGMADVTSIVKPIIDAAAAGITNLAVEEGALNSSIEGTQLVVIFDDPSVDFGSVIIAFGTSDPAGDSFKLNFPTLTTQELTGHWMSLSSAYSIGSGQVSTVDISVDDAASVRLSNFAGHHDDGEASNGALFTIGGVGDSYSNPDLSAVWSSTIDDELYSLDPFLASGSSSLTITTQNASNDDNISQVVAYFKSVALENAVSISDPTIDSALGTPAPPASQSGAASTSPAPYTGPLLQEFSSRTLDVCTPKSITITGTRLSGVTASVQGKPVTVLENTATKLVLAFPSGLTPGQDVDLVINSSSGTLTHQDAFDIPADTCETELSKGRWTQLQSDGQTVKMYAKDPIGDGKIQFFVDGEEIAWVNAADEADPKLSFASSYPYLVRSVELKPGKNRFEIKLDGVRVWRATYVPKG